MTAQGTNLLLKLKERQIKDIREDERKKCFDEFIKLYEDNVKIPPKNGRCSCCIAWINEALRFKKKLQIIKEK